ncbi:lytic polysaccharide monooxygenase [Streptomyces sp. NPDC102274]|uniref:lytic polysaccharide monooxygenase auxiliary activity family 9 protein n=1 Tax=Streptomyces sp. NPDC102274 TaxID=3366151 RepID=UPI0037F70623
MTVRRTATGIVVLGLAPLALAGLAAVPAAAHGSMTDPVSRVAACFADGPESPRSAACKAAVAAGGTQALYDWNEVNIANAAGNHRQLIPDGKLCGAGKDKYKGLDLARGDWPSSELAPGNRTFRYKATAPHRGSFELYVTKDGYDPGKPLKWSDLEEKPFLKVTDPKLESGAYVFDGIVPNKSGRHLIYSIWQRSDSPEAFYTCSDVVFGQDNGGAGGAASAASAPTDEKIADASEKSTVEHNGHGDLGTDATKVSAKDTPAAPETSETSETPEKQPDTSTDDAYSDTRAEAEANSPAAKSADGQDTLAATGGDSTTSYLAIGGAAALAIGAAVTFGTARRKAVSAGRHSR